MVPEIRIEAFVLFFIDHELLGLCIVNPPNGRRCARRETALPEHSPVLCARVFQGGCNGERARPVTAVVAALVGSLPELSVRERLIT